MSCSSTRASSEFTHDDRSFTYKGVTYLVPQEIAWELDEDQKAWHQYITEDSGLFVWSTLAEDYVLKTEQETVEREIEDEWRWAEEHIKSESMKGVFV